MLGVEDARAARGGPRKLDRALDGLGAGVRRDHRHDPLRCTLDERLREGAGEGGDAELGEVRAVRIQQRVELGDHVRVVAAHGEGAVTAEQVEVAVALRVDQVRALAADPLAVEAQGAHDPPELRVEVAIVERHRVGAARERLGDGRGQIGHRWKRTRSGGEVPLRRATLASQS